MNLNPKNSGSEKIQLPEEMRQKLKGFQRRVWLVKFCEGLLAAAFGLLASFLVVLVADRFFETPAWLRLAVLILGAMGLGIWFPLVCHRWIWKSRRLDQVARLLRRRLPRLGDHLLGIIELINNAGQRDRSESLCKAALHQVNEEIKDKDFSHAVPSPRHRRWAWIAGVPAVIAIAAALFVPAASANAFARWIAPWKNVKRYTFAQLDSLPTSIVVPVAERSQLEARLSDSSKWKPGSGIAIINGQKVLSDNEESKFQFSIPPLKETAEVKIRVGDSRKSVSFEPMSRPELSSVMAKITLPNYLQRTEKLAKDVRGGRVTVVDGSQFSLQGVATRELESASVNGKPVVPIGDCIETENAFASESTKVSLEWKDAHGLTAKTPLSINVRVVADESPTLICKRLENRRVIQEKEVLSFDVTAEDDFGVKKVGLEWRGTGTDENESEVKGEKIVASGNANLEEMNALATFSPRRQGIAPQPISLRIFAEDYMPERGRVYSPIYQVFVLSEDEHAIWLSRRLNQWQKETLETFERETQLFNQNHAIREMSASELDRPETRNQIEKQVAAERAQEQRLSALVRQGDGLVKDATNNDQFNVNTLESLAESIAALKAIAGDRMPSVADLLKKAADAQGSSPSNSPQVTDNQPTRSDQKSKKSESEEGEKSKSRRTPSIALKESSMDSPPKDEEAGEEEKAKPASSNLTLPTVTLKDNSPKKPGASAPAKKQMDEVVKEQEDLLAEFAKVAEELQKLVTNLEGSTFVKRLKAMSRKQLKIASDVNATSVSKFGVEKQQLAQSAQERSLTLSKRESEYTETMDYIYTDLEAYANRVPDKKYKTVLNEMKTELPSQQLRDIAEQIVDNEPGGSIAHAELLADTLDRWAEQMVGPG